MPSRPLFASIASVEYGFFEKRSWHNEATGPKKVRSMLGDMCAMDVHAFRSELVAYEHRVIGTPDFAIGRGRLTGQLIGEAAPLPFLCVVQLQSGGQAVTSSMRTHVRRDSTPFLFPLQGRKWVQWDRTDLQQIILRQESVDRELARLRLPPLRELPLVTDPCVEMVGSWEAAARYARALSQAPSLANSLIRASVFRALVTALVTTFTDIATSAAGDSASDEVASPAGIRRALDYIDAHAREPLTVADIAQHAGLSSRGLQAAFARRVGTSPMHALRQARLRGAHTELADSPPDDGETVSSIAARWGFTNLGRFAQHHREAFGSNPSDVLSNR